MRRQKVQERIGVIRATIEAPRWMRIPSKIKDLAWMNKVELKIETDKGWIFEDIRFSVTGKESNLCSFQRDIRKLPGFSREE